MKRIIIVLTMVMLAAAYVFAAQTPTSGMSYAGEWFNGTDATSSIFVKGGTFASLNLTLNQQTSNWAVLYGNIDSVLLFRGIGGVTAFQWGASNPVADYVFFAINAVVDWGNLAASGAEAQLQGEDTLLGLTSDDLDSVNKTFSAATNNPAISYPGVNIAQDTTFNVQTNDDVGAFWNTSFVWDSTNTRGVYVAHANDGQTSFDGNTVDYQVMLPTPAAGNRTYYMFVALQ